MNAETPSRSCTECGQPLAATATFCRGCGTRYAPPEPRQEVGSEASAQPQQPPASTSKSSPARRWGRVALIVVGALVLVGASAGATVLMLDKDESGEGTGERPISSVPVDGDADSLRSGEAVSGGAGSESSPREAAEMASEIQPALLAFYEDVVAHRYRDAWERLSERKRQQNLSEYTYRQWAEEGVGSLADYLDPSGLTVRVDGVEADGSVRVLLTGMTWSDPDSACSEWSGLTWVKLEDGAWALDSGYSTTPERRRLWEPREDELLGVGC